MGKDISVSLLSFVFLHYCLCLVCQYVVICTAESEVPAVFIFGDSTLDVGTNNNLLGSTARADFLPNGIDFPYSLPTGRFSDGFNSADQIVKLLGYQMSPRPFLSLVHDMSSFRRNILQGVNFASAGSGILRETGQHRFKEVVSLGKQIQQFAIVEGNLTEVMGPEATAAMLSKCLFLLSVGSNDLLDYSQSKSSKLPNDVYMKTLQATYHDHLKNLFNLGARKFGIVGVPPIGCCPAARANNSAGAYCVEELNELAQIFYKLTEALLVNLSYELKEMKYSLGNAYKMTMSIIENPLVFGFKDIKSACCGGGTLNGQVPCAHFLNSTLCLNRDEYLFWDMYHPTEHASKLAALTLYGGGTSLVKPVNLSQLVTASS